jgi:hypothetical protein
MMVCATIHPTLFWVISIKQNISKMITSDHHESLVIRCFLEFSFSRFIDFHNEQLAPIEFVLTGGP